MNSLEWTTAVLTRSDLTATEKLVALALGHHGALKGECWPSLLRLAMECSLHRLTVIRAMRKLEAVGLIHRTPGRTGKATHYVLKVPRTSNTEYTLPVTLDAQTSNSEYTPTKKLSKQATLALDEQSKATKRQLQIEKLTANGLPVTDGDLDEWVSVIELARYHRKTAGWAIKVMAEAEAKGPSEGKSAVLDAIAGEMRQERQG